MVDCMGNDLSIVSAAKVSFNRDFIEVNDEKNYKLIQYLLKNKHSSPFEHVIFKFHVKAPLFVARQWMRHRTFSYNEISRRYTSDNLDFYIPNFYRKQSMDNKQASDGEVDLKDNFELIEETKKITEQSLILYNNMIDKGVAREQARMILPQSLFTRFYVTGNLWNWLHFIELRDHPHAQLEIKEYAQEIKRKIKLNNPITIEVWEKVKEER